jgi:hypothetical protein
MGKYASVVIVVLAVCLSGALVFSVDASGRATSLETRIAALERERTDLQTRLRPFEERQRAVVHIKQELVASANTVQRYTFAPAAVPGTLSGTWRSSGRGFDGADDTISGFRLTDPSDGVLYTSDRATSGTFLVKVTAAGAYTFFVENAGLFRSTPRRVFLDAEFRPD